MPWAFLASGVILPPSVPGLLPLLGVAGGVAGEVAASVAVAPVAAVAPVPVAPALLPPRAYASKSWLYFAHTKEQMSHVIIIPAGTFAAASQASFATAILAHNV